MPAESQNKEKVLVEWTAPTRPFKRRSRDFYITLVSIAALLGLILFLIEGVMPALLIVALVFLFYVMSTVEPGNAKYQITNFGLKIGGRLTDWVMLGRFWFIERSDAHVLVIETAALPGRIELVVSTEIKEKIVKALSKYLPHEEVSPSRLDKVTHWVSKKLPA